MAGYRPDMSTGSLRAIRVIRYVCRMCRGQRCRRGSFVLVVGLCWLLVFVAGCSGSEPSPAPTSRHPGTAATSTPTSPSADPTDIAAAAAIAAVNKLYAEYNAMLKSGSSASYRQTFTSKCGLCLTNANRLDGISAKHQRVQGGRLNPNRLKAVLFRSRRVLVQGELHSPSAVVVQGRHVIQRFPDGGTHDYTWDVIQSGSGWLVADLQALT